MVKHGGLLNRILGLVPRVEFAEIVRKRRAEWGCKDFSSWDQFVAMLLCQFGQARSCGRAWVVLVRYRARGFTSG